MVDLFGPKAGEGSPAVALRSRVPARSLVLVKVAAEVTDAS